METPTLIWEGKKFPCREALKKIKEALAFELKSSVSNKITRKEIAINFNPASGMYRVYVILVDWDNNGTALEDGFIAREGYLN